MSLFNIFQISGSAMTAQSMRLNTVASNLANADSVAGPDGQPYRAKQVVFQAVPMPSDSTRGVRVAQVVEDASPPRMVYDPKSPAANAEGYVYRSNVNPLEEMTDMLDAARSYETAITTASTARELMMRTIDMNTK